MQKYLVRFYMFFPLVLLAFVTPALGIAIPVVLGLLEWSGYGGIYGEQRAKFLCLTAGGLTGIAIHYALPLFG